MHRTSSPLVNLLHLMTDCNSRQRYKSVSVTSSTTNLWVSQQVLLLCNQILLFLFPRSLLKPSPLRSPFPQTEQQRLFPDAHSPIRTSSNEQHGPESEKGKETTGKTVTHQREASGGSGRAHDEGGPAPGAERALRPEIHLHCRRQNLPPQPSLTLPDPPSLSLVQEKKRKDRLLLLLLLLSLSLTRYFITPASTYLHRNAQLGCLDEALATRPLASRHRGSPRPLDRKGKGGSCLSRARARVCDCRQPASISFVVGKDFFCGGMCGRRWTTAAMGVGRVGAAPRAERDGSKSGSRSLPRDRDTRACLLHPENQKHIKSSRCMEH